MLWTLETQYIYRKDGVSYLTSTDVTGIDLVNIHYAMGVKKAAVEELGHEFVQFAVYPDFEGEEDDVVHPE